MPIRPGLELEVFTDWSEVVGSVLAEAGGESFLGNLRARDEAEDDRAADADALLELAREAFGDEFFTARQLVTGVGALSARVVDLTGLRPGDSRLVNRLGEHLNGHRSRGRRLPPRRRSRVWCLRCRRTRGSSP